MLVRVLSVLSGCRRAEVSGAMGKDLFWVERPDKKTSFLVTFSAAKKKSNTKINCNFPLALVEHFKYFLIFTLL
jgi:hypothetical protein